MSGYGGYEYDNANADSGGGGFLSQSNRESEGGEKEKKPRDKQTLTPVTIKQLQAAEKGVGDDDGYKIDNAEIHSVRVVACVQTDEVRETKATYNIEDGTGSVEVTFWLNDAQDEDSWARQKLAKMTPGAYVVVHGIIKEYDGRLTISAYDMRPVEDFNQVPPHYLAAIYVHAKRVGKIQVSSGAAPAAKRDSMAGFHPTTHGQSAAGGAEGADGMTSLQKRVLDYYTENGTGDEGCNTDSVAASLGLDLGQVKAAVEFLSSEGHLYSTIDEDHHKSTSE